jgi:hypothetical protein
MIEGAYTGEKNEEGQRHGRGILIIPEPAEYDLDPPCKINLIKDWEMYQGNFQADLCHGAATLMLRDGSKFEGEFVEGRAKAGILVQLTGDQFAGDCDEEGNFEGYCM